MDYLSYLYTTENENRDRYIQRVPVARTGIQAQTEAGKILLELEDMLNPELPLYPNPTRDCSRMCGMLSPCVSFDDGSDWEIELESEFASRDLAGERLWRMRLPPAHELIKMEKDGQAPDLEGIQSQASASAYKIAELESGEVAYGDDDSDEAAPTTFDITSVS